jgi:hypothetical protein
MHPGERQGVERRDDLLGDRLRGKAVAGRRRIGLAAAEQFRPVDAARLGNRRHPAVPEPGIAGKAVQHHHRGLVLPRPQIIVDGAVEDEALGNRDLRHRC